MSLIIGIVVLGFSIIIYQIINLILSHREKMARINKED